MPAAAEPAAQLTPPSAIGVPHTCLQFYPPVAMRLGVQGRTTIGFVIKEDGNVQNAAVLISSGNDLLDKATIDCANAWTYKPAMRDGTPIAVPWKVRVEWYLHDTYEGPAQDKTASADAHWIEAIAAAGESHGCATSLNFATTDQPLQVPTGPSVVQFTITADGITRDFTVTRKSGSDRHDAAAVACVKDWHYQPARRDGKPVSVRWTATIPWRDPTASN